MTFPSKETPSSFHSHTRPIPVLLIQTEGSLSQAAQDILQVKFAFRHFQLTVVPTLRDAFREIESVNPDVILIDVVPSEDPEMRALTRLHQYIPDTPVVALLPDPDQNFALKVLQSGAHHYLLASQLTEEILPGFLMRTIERHAAQLAIQESEERFRLMVENASDVILMMDPGGFISYAGPSTERILNHKPAELTGKNAFDFVHRDDRRRFVENLELAFSTGILSSVQFRFRRNENDWIHLEAKGRVVPDALGKSVCIMNSHDVSHRVKLEEELRSLSLRDELTGLHNRRSFVTHLEQQLKLAQRAYKSGIYLLFIDLDDFKWINDNLSHKEGDRALIDAARILKNTFRDADIVARLGGDEFVIFLSDDCAAADVEALRRRLTDAVDDFNIKNGRPYRIAMSIGVIHDDLKHRRTTEELLLKADEVMYAQKKARKLAKAQALQAASPAIQLPEQAH